MTKLNGFRLLLMIVFQLTNSILYASEFSKSVDEIFSFIDDKNAPGCSVGVIEKGVFIHKAGYGLANLELGVELDGNQIHRMASVSKQFTAMAVLLLAEEFDIDLEDDIRTHLPELVNYGESVSINAMLGHFAGMANYDALADPQFGINLKSVAGGPFRLGKEDYLEIQEFYEIVKKLPLKRKPNQQFEYSNIAYFLFSMLVKEVSGMSLREYAELRMFEPLGMSQTFFSDDSVEIVKGRATGYRKKADGTGYLTDMTNLFWVGDGGLHTNLDDMLKWDQHFYSPKLGREPATLIKRFNIPNDKSLIDSDQFYANGQFFSEVDGRKRFGHSGAWMGTSTYYVRYQEAEFSIVMMCNDTSLPIIKLSKQISDLYFESK